MDDSSTSRRKVVSEGQSTDGKCVIYVMSRDQRVRDNHALFLAQKDALDSGLPFAVVFCLKPKSGYRAREHYEWMLVGLEEVERKLDDLNIPLILLIGEPYERLKGLIAHVRPRSIYFDMNPLRGPRSLVESIAKDCAADTFVVDTHNVVPIWVTSEKQEYAARTIRSKIHRQLDNYLTEPDQPAVHPISWPGKVIRIKDLSDKIDHLLDGLNSNGQQNLLDMYPTGNDNARKHLREFLDTKLASYADNRSDPSIDGLSGLSPYLHFGRISSLRVVLETKKYASENPKAENSLNTLIEEMVVRKELSDNYCFYNHKYDSLLGTPNWSQDTLSRHATDDREFLYCLAEFEQAKTHDNAWNAAQLQLIKTGKIHGYMRMYWAKKVLEWSDSPEQAIKTLIYLNDFYSIDGGDPNGYVGIMWSVAGVHDRPWGERPVYGTIRSMVYGGLKRKFDIQQYEQTWLKTNL